MVVAASNTYLATGWILQHVKKGAKR